LARAKRLFGEGKRKHTPKGTHGISGATATKKHTDGPKKHTDTHGFFKGKLLLLLLVAILRQVCGEHARARRAYVLILL
jgi:hypothetical protein